MIAMTENTHTTFVSPPSGSGKSMLDTMLQLQGVPFVAGPVHTDGPKEFAEAERAAHDIEACLPNLHDTILDATGKSLSDCDLRQLLAQLPEEIREQVDDWGLADTDVREQIYAHIRQHGL